MYQREMATIALGVGVGFAVGWFLRGRLRSSLACLSGRTSRNNEVSYLIFVAVRFTYKNVANPTGENIVFEHTNTLYI